VWSVLGRGTQSILRARGPCRAWSCGPSTSPLAAMSRTSTRPALVWVITVCYAVAFALTAIGSWYMFRHWETFPEAAKAPLRALPLSAWIWAAIGTALTVTAIVQLFRMRRSAFYLYATAMVLSITTSVWYYATGTYHPSTRAVVVLLLQLLICFYVWRLQRANLLS